MNAVVTMPQPGGIPAAMIQYAMEKGADIEKLEQLFALQQKYEANEARKAYVKAMSEFKKNPPEITKDKQVSFGTTSYMHATIGNVVEQIVGGLAKHGFSHRWIPLIADGKISVTCTITHELGHSEDTTLGPVAFDTSGGKNAIQTVISAQTYLQRHTIIAATGLATKDQVDDDGRGAAPTGLPAEREGELVKQIKATTTATAAKKAWQAGVKECRDLNDVEAANRLKEIMLAHAATLEQEPANAAG